MVVTMGIADDFGTVIIKVDFTSSSKINVTYSSNSTAGYWVSIKGVK